MYITEEPYSGMYTAEEPCPGMTAAIFSMKAVMCGLAWMLKVLSPNMSVK